MYQFNKLESEIQKESIAAMEEQLARAKTRLAIALVLEEKEFPRNFVSEAAFPLAVVSVGSFQKTEAMKVLEGLAGRCETEAAFNEIVGKINAVRNDAGLFNFNFTPDHYSRSRAKFLNESRNISGF